MKRYAYFFLASLALAVAPGPDILFVLAQSLTGGWRAGSFITFGLCTGLVFHVSLAAFGIAAVLKKYPAAFKAVTWLGAAYLVYLGVLAWRDASVTHIASGGEVTTAAVEPLRLYVRGIVMNVLNPKVMLFFLALVPRFVAPEKGRPALQFVALGLVFALAVLLVFHVVALGAGFATSGFAADLFGLASGDGRLLRYFSAVVMFGIAGWIAWRNATE